MSKQKEFHGRSLEEIKNGLLPASTDKLDIRTLTYIHDRIFSIAFRDQYDYQNSSGLKHQYLMGEMRTILEIRELIWNEIVNQKVDCIQCKRILSRNEKYYFKDTCERCKLGPKIFRSKQRILKAIERAGKQER